MNFVQIIQQYGELYVYPITFVWTALEGETFVIIGGFLSQKGWINPYGLFAAAWLGSMAGDQLFFLLGRRYGVKVLDHMPRLKPKLEKALGWIERYSVLYILAYRFMYGLRNVSAVALGLSHIVWKKFAFWNMLASALWAASFVGAGYWFGRMIARFGRHKEDVVGHMVRNVTISVLIVFVVVVAAMIIFDRWRSRKKDEQA